MSNPAPPPSRAATRWFSPQDWSLRVKLAVALLVPSLIAIVLGGLRVADQAGEAAEFDRVARYATAQGEVADLVKRIQDERLRTTEFVAAGRTGDTTALQASFAEVDAEQAASRSAVAAVAEDDTTVVGAQRQAEQALVRIPQLRDLVLKSDSSPAAVVSRYSELIDQILPLDSSLLRGVNTPEVNGLANALGGLSSARDEATLQEALITVAAGAREARSGELTGLPASEARLATGLDNFRTALDSGQRVRYAGMIAGPANNDRAALVTELTGADQTQALPGGTGVRAAKVYGDFIGEMDSAEDGIRGELAATGESARSTAVNLAVLNVVVLLAALIIGAIIVGLIARALISSLRTLRSSALEIAQKRLPDAVQRMRGGTVPDVNVTPVPVHTREEVGEVARAFDAVHEQAVRLAAEQATLQNTVNSMFVNLSRRSQSLVDRQLQLIEELESNEQDPDQLASLFRLDHLATRMRRNSENLLVLAGTDLAKRTAHHVPVVDVLQAAVSEVEQYERVTVEQPPAVAVLGRAANDLQHLLSELLDNATSFSPPETQVTMSTSRAGAGPLVVEIVDRGIGMRPDELDEINKRFADADDTRITASRRMGLFVVGRLAARHGVQVRLFGGTPASESAQGSTGPLSRKDGGVTARVTIPAHLVASGPAGMARRPEGKSARPAAGAQPSIAVPPQRIGSGEHPRSTQAGDGPEDDRGSGRTGARSTRAGTGAAEDRAAERTPADSIGKPDTDHSELAKRIPVQSSTAGSELVRARSDRSGTADPEPVDEQSADADAARAADPETGVEAADDDSVSAGSVPADADAADSDTADSGSTDSGTAGPDAAGSGRARAGAHEFREQQGDGTGAAGARQPAAEAGAGSEPATREQGNEFAAAMGAPELFGPAPVFDPDEEPLSRTPIFEEVASGWFRAYRQVPINWQPDDNGAVPEEIDLDRPARPAGAAAAPPPVPDGPLPVPSWPPVATAQTAQPDQTAQSVPTAGHSQTGATRRDDDFATAADDGWRAAVESRREVRVDLVPGTDLPRRTPGAQLVPGGIAAAGAGGSARDADAIRSRLSNYQRGVRTGRSARERPESEAAPAVAGSGDADVPVAESVGSGSAGADSAVAGPAGTGSAVGGPVGAGSAPAGSQGADPVDAGSAEASAVGAGSVDAAPDVGPTDVGPTDVGPADVGPADEADRSDSDPTPTDPTEARSDGPAAPAGGHRSTGAGAGGAGSARTGRRRLLADRGGSGRPATGEPGRGSAGSSQGESADAGSEALEAGSSSSGPDRAGSTEPGSSSSGPDRAGSTEPGSDRSASGPADSSPDDSAGSGEPAHDLPSTGRPTVAGSGSGSATAPTTATRTGSHELRADRIVGAASPVVGPDVDEPGAAGSGDRGPATDTGARSGDRQSLAGLDAGNSADTTDTAPSTSGSSTSEVVAADVTTGSGTAASGSVAEGSGGVDSSRSESPHSDPDTSDPKGLNSGVSVSADSDPGRSDSAVPLSSPPESAGGGDPAAHDSADLATGSGSEVPGPDGPGSEGTDPARPDVSSPDLPSPDSPSPDLPSPDLPSPDLPSPDLPSPDLPSLDSSRPDSVSPDPDAAVADAAAVRHRSLERAGSIGPEPTGVTNGSSGSVAASEPPRSERTPVARSSADAQRTVGRPQEPNKRGR